MTLARLHWAMPCGDYYWHYNPCNLSSSSSHCSSFQVRVPVDESWGHQTLAWNIMMLLNSGVYVQYIPRNMHTVFALLCFVVVKHWLIFPYPSGLLHWHCGNLTIAPVPAKQPWWLWINTSFEFIMNDYITTTKQSTTKPCAYFLGYTVPYCVMVPSHHRGATQASWYHKLTTVCWPSFTLVACPFREKKKLSVPCLFPSKLPLMRRRLQCHGVIMVRFYDYITST